ncbi:MULTISPECIES: tyrosine-type recombinase/integrase [Agrobacterium]|uniref:Integrase n=2 Tax=Pseudomonadota TaxID=1224 RepID=A0A9X3R1Q4_9HYPH|nr:MULTISPECIES: tyrosine-type recombinase/integrase [Agrobacterium]MCZ7854894.1 tyrosine-type recombinase/integrase [Agrobacterium salinitolerans]MCZ7894649.1 tyrosine-type recombinase/integrase [Agrobacterium salinitolerans]MCZ7940537.1 tyrosine-type recombinase/integrase [Agrobacterium salinitolerans]MCZ7977654.1 tyrosine-type recombinase/integrase [Agrobacterium salinitolerans]MDA5631373.1 tyrosine-type recombinase/integrase [Agrobacterium sp. ST15.16.055]
MTALALSAPSAALPALVHPSDERTRMRFLEFFTANIRNPNTRKAYARSAADFLHWCEARGVSALPQIQPMHVAAWIEELGRSHAVPTVKQRLAAIRHLFDWMVTGQIMPTNPAHAVRGPSYSTKKGKTPVLSPEEARQLLDSIPTDTIVGLRDRAFIATMTFTFARVGAATGMEVRDVYVQGRRLWVRLHEKGGKVVEMPCHHTLEAYLEEYLEVGGLRDHPKTPLFRTIGRGTGELSASPLPQQSAHAMIQRRAVAAGIGTAVGNHTFRATGITAYLKNGGTLEKAAAMANHSSTRTTQLYDRRSDDVSLDEVERILI